MNANPPPVEVTTRYTTTVSDLPAAWSFVMDRLDKVGPDPSITITPRWIYDMGQITEAMDGRDEERVPRQFEVVVSGMVHEPPAPVVTPSTSGDES